ncbi:hypothetical protein [Streptomyces sp. TS71-3]|uniref:hypothetical protein n=1 Tax=Streptomyces sp. TS71-3 TaxID=2733862 RepID=UPI001B2D6584|nr:hypothetical protein [Streptomyces sp. TS71-3]GHJ36711.1 hypothetical protein Sm713_23200 [Streptomyces sp. TS71-3]
MADATGALTPLAAPTQLNVTETRAVVRSLLKHSQPPTGAALTIALVNLRNKIQILMLGVQELSETTRSEEFRAAGKAILFHANLLLKHTVNSKVSGQDTLRCWARLILRLAGAYELLGGGETCPPMP